MENVLSSVSYGCLESSTFVSRAPGGLIQKKFNYCEISNWNGETESLIVKHDAVIKLVLCENFTSNSMIRWSLE